MHVRNGTAKTDPVGGGDKFKWEETTGGGRQTFFFCRNLVDNLSRREEVLAYFIFWGWEWFFLYPFLLILVRFCPSKNQQQRSRE